MMISKGASAHLRTRAISDQDLVQKGPLTLDRHIWLRSLLLFVLAAVVLFVADSAVLRMHSGDYVEAIGHYRDKPFLQAANNQEVEESGTSYRWTTSESTMSFSELGPANSAQLVLHLGGRPQAGELELTLNGQPWTSLTATVEPRHYVLDLPIPLPDSIVIGLGGDTFKVDGDPRELGVKIVGFELQLTRPSIPFPVTTQYLAQVGILLAAAFASLRLLWSARAQAILLAALAIILALVMGSELLLGYAYFMPLAYSAIWLAGITWLFLPLAERYAYKQTNITIREIHILWALMLGACALRLSGIMYPTYAGQDLHLNLSRLYRTIMGQLIVIAPSSEFANGITIYPPGPYLTTMPGSLAISNYGLLMQGLMGTLDGSSAFFVALIARKLGGSMRAGIFALLMYSVSLPTFAVLQFGFSAQVFGQWFTAPLFLLLLHSRQAPKPLTWLFVAFLSMFGWYSHIGVAILAVTWIAYALLLTLLHDRRSAITGMVMMTALGLLAVALLYIDIAPTTLSHAGNTVTSDDKGWYPGLTPLLWKGSLLAYTEVGLFLLPVGLLLIAWRKDGWGRKVAPLAIILTALTYFYVDIAWLMQVRYFYFALPLAIPAIAIALSRIANRGPLGRTAAWVLVALIVLQGAMAWYGTTFGEIRISMTPLTH